MKCKKIISIVLCMIVTLSIIPVMQNKYVKANVEIVPDGYKGIYTLMDLYGISNDLDGKYILMNDIDMTEATSEGGDFDCGNGWPSIQNFQGDFNGNGYRIIGMNIFGTLTPEFYTQNGSGCYYYCGLFGYCSNASIYNLTMKDCKINIEGVEDTKGISNEEHYLNIGSIAGEVDYLIAFYNCVATGNISVNIEKSERICCGGLLGEAYCDEEDYYVNNVYNGCQLIGNIVGYDTYSYCYIGGIVGRIYNRWYGSTVVSNSYNVGNIETTIDVVTGRVGAIYGYSDYSYRNQCTNCYFLKDTAEYGIGNKTNIGCKPLNYFLMKSKEAYVGFDFENTWIMDAYCSYPYPQLKDNMHMRVNSIEIIDKPEQVVFDQGDDISVDGGVLEITYEDEMKVQLPISLEMLSGYNMNTIGIQKVIVDYNGVTTSYDIEVKEIPLTDIKLNEEEVNLYRNYSLQLTPVYIPINASYKDGTWSSSDNSIATVDANGMVMGKNKGDAIITITSSNGLIATCIVHVQIESVNISLNKSSSTLNIGDILILDAKVLPLNTTDTVSWSSSNPAIAFVESGKVIANKVGKAKIFAKTESGISAVCTVTVIEPEKNNSIDSQTIKESNKVKSIKASISSIKNVKSKTLKLKLKQEKGCTGFQIQYGTKKEFKAAKTIRTKSVNVNIKKLKKNKKYYIRVRVYKVINGKIYYGKWSKTKSKKITK